MWGCVLFIENTMKVLLILALLCIASGLLFVFAISKKVPDMQEEIPQQNIQSDTTSSTEQKLDTILDTPHPLTKEQKILLFGEE